MLRAALLVCAALIALGAAACGDGAGGDGGPRDVDLVLDFLPNGVHVGLYLARARALDEAQGVHLALAPPGQTSDPLKLVASGRADFGIVDLIDLALARERGEPLTAVAAIVQRPTGSILALGDGPVRRPRDLEGRAVGLTGVPSDPAIVDSVIRADGGDPAAVEHVVIGFNAVQSLAAGTVAGAVGFWPADGVALERTGQAVTAFRLDAFGAPPFPELVLFTRDEVRDEQPELVASVVAAVDAGYAAAIADPDAGLDALVAGAAGVDRDEAAAQLDAYRTIFEADGRAFGTLDPAVIDAFARWLETSGVASSPVDAAALARP